MYISFLKKISWRFFFNIIICLGSIESFSSGFFILEQGVEGFKTGYAGATTTSQGPEAVFFNPALLAQTPKTQLSLGAHYLNPHFKFKNHASTLYGRPLNAEQKNNFFKSAVLPNIYFSTPVNEDFAIGLGIMVPFGIKSDYSQNWAGRYHAVKTELKTSTINPAFAYKANEWLSVGFGLFAQKAEAELSSMIDFGGLGRKMGTKPQSSDGKVVVKGHDWGYGFNMGALVTPTEKLKIGANFRSSVAYKLKGHAEFELTPIGNMVKKLTGAFENSAIRSGLTLPEVAFLGAAYRLTPEWEIMADVTYTHWKRLKELRVEFANKKQADDVLPMNWRNSFRYAAGVKHFLNDQWQIGFGGGIDKSPVTKKDLGPRAPDADRYFLHTGLSYKMTDFLHLDAGYGRIIFKKIKMDIDHPMKGHLKGSYKAHANIFNVQARICL